MDGQGWPNEVSSVFYRLPERAQKDVRDAVWKLSKQAAGLSIRFWSNATNIHVKYKLKGSISLPHMPATGVSGLDLYSKSPKGKWARHWGKYSIDSISNYKFTIKERSESYLQSGKEYQLFLPLYNEVVSLEIGTPKESSLKELPRRKEKPIVAYGTSICQGACASRPGMTWANILDRKLERPIINLGFSGNGELEPALIDLMTEIDAKLYILDCLPNLSIPKDDVYSLTLNAVRTLKEKRPNTPIILTAHLGYADELTNEKVGSKISDLNKELTIAFHKLKSEGHTGVYLLTKNDLHFNFDMYVDNLHPNDYGMVQYANVYLKLIREILEHPTNPL